MPNVISAACMCWFSLSLSLSLSDGLLATCTYAPQREPGYCLLKIASLYSGVQALLANNVLQVLTSHLLSSSESNLLLVSTRVVATLLEVRTSTPPRTLVLHLLGSHWLARGNACIRSTACVRASIATRSLSSTCTAC
jgi:hypothetical protein